MQYVLHFSCRDLGVSVCLVTSPFHKGFLYFKIHLHPLLLRSMAASEFLIIDHKEVSQ
jgi:hypothetical protein